MTKLNETFILPSPRVFNVAAFGSGRTDIEVQAAVDAAASAGGGVVFIPPGDWSFGNTVQLPSLDLEVYGVRGMSRISGTPAAMFAYPDAVSVSGRVRCQDIHDLFFILSEGQTGIKCHQTWDGAGKRGPRIYHNDFEHISMSSPSTTKAISLRGIWTARIFGNMVKGNYAAVDRPQGGGYFVYTELGEDVSTHVMNLSITDNTTVGVAYPVFAPPRVGNGRVEGLGVVNNTFIAGNQAVSLDQVLAFRINDNIISAWRNPIVLDGSFFGKIVGNSEIDASDSACITVRGTANSFAEKLTITGNSLKPFGSSCGVLFVNDAGVERIRDVSVTGNNIARTFIAGPTACGIRFSNSFPIRGVGIANNTFSSLAVGIDYQSSVDNGDIRVSGNTWNNVTQRIQNPSRSGTLLEKRYTASTVVTLTGGATSEQVNFAVPANVFSSKPTVASCISDASHTADPMLGFYAFDGSNSTPINLRFRVVRMDGANLIGANRRFTVEAHGTGFATE